MKVNSNLPEPVKEKLVNYIINTNNIPINLNHFFDYDDEDGSYDGMMVFEFTKYEIIDGVLNVEYIEKTDFPEIEKKEKERMYQMKLL